MSEFIEIPNPEVLCSVVKRSKWLRLWTPKTALIKDRNLFLVNTIEPLQCRQINLCHYGYDVDGQLDQEGCITLISFTHGDEDIYIRNIGEREYFESLKAIICARCQYFGQLYKSINILLPYSFHGIGSFRQYNESQTLLTSYSGEHVYGINTGQGVYRIYDSAINSDVVTFEYNGEFLNGERNGFGCAIWPHNIYVNCYTGAWKNNRKHGIGIEKYYGTKYEGHWISDLRHGIGTLTNIFDKNVYHGKWEQGELTEGELRFYDGASRYEGNFLHFVPSGMGTFFYSNGDTYNGDVCEGKRLGKGLYTHGIYQLHGEWISHGTMRGNIYTDDKIIKTDIHVVLVNDVCNGRVITLDLTSKALYIGSLSELASLNHCKTIQYNGQIESIHEEMLHYYNGEENIAFVTQRVLASVVEVQVEDGDSESEEGGGVQTSSPSEHVMSVIESFMRESCTSIAVPLVTSASIDMAIASELQTRLSGIVHGNLMEPPTSYFASEDFISINASTRK